MSENTTPICGETDCGICPTPEDMDERGEIMAMEDRRNANLILGLPEFFGLDPHYNAGNILGYCGDNDVCGGCFECWPCPSFTDPSGDQDGE